VTTTAVKGVISRSSMPTLPGQHRFCCRIDPRTTARPGQQIEVAFDIDRIHVFDADTEAAIGLPATHLRAGSGGVEPK